MNYWLITTEYPPFFGGGIGTYCKQTAIMLSNKGYLVTVFVNDLSVSNIKIVSSDNVRIIRFNPNRTKSSSFLGHTANLSYEFAAIIKEFVEKEGKPDILEAQEYLGIAYYVLQYKYLLTEWCKDIPILLTMHSPSFLYMEYNHVSLYRYPNYWIGEMERFCLQAADWVISPSQYIIDELFKRFDLSHKNISIIPNPYTISEKSKSLNISNERDEIIFYGKLSVQKGGFKLLQYFDELWAGGFNRTLFVIGGQDIIYHPEGKPMGEILKRKYANRIKQGLLVFENSISPASLPNRLERAELIIIPSMTDNLPYVALEAMALENVVLVSKQGGQSEIIDNGVDGFVFDHFSEADFADKLLYILSLSKQEKTVIAQRAKNKIETNYNYTKIFKLKAEQVCQVIKESKDKKREFPSIRKLSVSYRSPQDINSPNKMLSVIVPYYNMGLYLDETITSIKNSDYPFIEIIIVNDGTTEASSLEKLKKYRNDEKLKIIDIPNRGLGNARNVGALKSTATYIAFLDADDKVEYSYYSKAIRILEQYVNVHFVGSWTRYFDNSNKTWPTFAPEPPLILYHNLVNSSALVYKRESFIEAGLNDTKMPFTGWEDYDSVIGMMSKGMNAVTIPEVLFNYRVRNNSMIRAVTKEKKFVLSEFLLRKHEVFFKSYTNDLFNLLTANGPGFLVDNPSLDLHLADKLPFKGKVAKKLGQLIKRNKYIRAAAFKLYRFYKK